MGPQGKLEETGRATAKRGFCRVNKAPEALALILLLLCDPLLRVLPGYRSIGTLLEARAGGGGKEKIYGRVG